MKLYWRHKKNGKWTWSAVKSQTDNPIAEIVDDLINYYRLLEPLEEE